MDLGEVDVPDVVNAGVEEQSKDRLKRISYRSEPIVHLLYPFVAVGGDVREEGEVLHQSACLSFGSVRWTEETPLRRLKRTGTRHLQEGQGFQVEWEICSFTRVDRVSRRNLQLQTDKVT